jgi:hypothetical protein
MSDADAALEERYRRLRAVAERVVNQAEAVGTREHPMAGVKPHLLRNLRRELDGEPQPNGLWMSVS